MATVTLDDIRSRCMSVSGNSVIEDFICVANSLVGGCLDQAYDECVAKVIQANLICHLLYLNDNPQRLSGFKTPNNTSESYAVYTSSTGLGLSSFGQQILLLDTAGCVQRNTSKTLFIGTSGRSDPPYGRRVRRI